MGSNCWVVKVARHVYLRSDPFGLIFDLFCTGGSQETEPKPWAKTDKDN